MDKKIIVVALGGNAILQAGQKGTCEEQVQNVKQAVEEIVKLIKDGYRVVLTHGNGPQVGNLYIQNSLAGEAVPPMPLDVVVAMTQGQIFMLTDLHADFSLDGISVLRIQDPEGKFLGLGGIVARNEVNSGFEICIRPSLVVV